MNILSMGWFDAAGVNTTFAKAWNKYGYGEWNTLFFQNYMQLRNDIDVSQLDWNKLKVRIDEADLIIMNPLLLDGAVDSHLMDDWTNMNVMQESGLPKFFFTYILTSGKPILF